MEKRTKKEAAGDDENSRYALEDAGKKGLRGRGTKRNETPVNASGTVSHLDKKLPGSSRAVNRRAETPFNVTGNPVFRLNAITELAFLLFLLLLSLFVPLFMKLFTLDIELLILKF